MCFPQTSRLLFFMYGVNCNVFHLTLVPNHLWTVTAKHKHKHTINVNIRNEKHEKHRPKCRSDNTITQCVLCEFDDLGRKRTNWKKHQSYMKNNMQQYYNIIWSLSLQFITCQIIHTLVLIWPHLYTYIGTSLSYPNVITLPLSISFDAKLKRYGFYKDMCFLFVPVHKNTQYLLDGFCSTIRHKIPNHI